MIEKERLVTIVRGLQEGDPEAATQLYETFQEDVYYFILKTVNNDRELAEDLTQDTFIEILETIGKLQEPVAFVTWSKQIAYHKCTAYFRKRKELLADENEDGYSVFDTFEEENEEFIPDAALEKDDLKNTIAAMINELPEEQKSALVLRYFNEISVKEIAQIQGVTEGTVKSRLNYGRKAIKQSVEAYEKKNGIKLRCVGIIPLLLWLFRQYRLAEGISLTAQTTETAGFLAGGALASASGASASSSAVASAAAKTGIKIGAKVISKKIIAAAVAGVVALGGITAGAVLAARANRVPQNEIVSDQVHMDEEKETTSTNTEKIKNRISGVQFYALLPENVTKVAFVNKEIPVDAQTIDVSADADNSVVAWVEEDTMYVTARNGNKIYAVGKGIGIFTGCANLTSIDLTWLDTTYITTMQEMFAGCESLQTIEFGDFNTSKVTNMSGMFEGCRSLTALEVATWDTGNVTYMNYMFKWNESLTTLDLSGWDTSNVETMAGMFYGCHAIEFINLDDWNTSNVTSMHEMFAWCEKLRVLDLSSFNVESVQGAGFNEMFLSCERLMTIYASDWTSQSNVDASQNKHMFMHASWLKSNYGTAENDFDMANTDGYFTEK